MADNPLDELFRLLAHDPDIRRTYEFRKVLETTLETHLRISTAWTDDNGYETALCDVNGTHPVERYKSRNAAVVGHAKWVKFADNPANETITKLGYGSLIPDEEITLKRN